MRVSGERELAEDLLQEAYCRLLTARLAAMDEDQSRSYLFRIATNLLHDWWRRHREYPLRDDLPEAESSDPHPDLKIEMRQAFQRLKGREPLAGMPAGLDARRGGRYAPDELGVDSGQQIGMAHVVRLLRAHTRGARRFRPF